MHSANKSKTPNSKFQSFMILLGLVALLILSGCATIGPATIARDRLDYSEAIAESWKRMMLFNIVKIRYGDTPIFLETSSVVNQYALETEVNAGADFSSGLLGDIYTVGGRGKYADRPTITYSPLTGQKLSQSLISPIPPDELLGLIQGGWRVDLLLRTCVTAINGHFNSSSVQMARRVADPKFLQLVDVLDRIQDAGGMGMRFIKRDGEKKAVAFFRRDYNEILEKDVLLALKLLGLDPEAKEYNLVYGSFQQNDKEIAVLTRSMLGISAELAAHVDVPTNDIIENRASSGAFDATDTISEKRSRVIIKSSVDEPDDAFVSIHYRDHWFYIDDTDFRSKRLFSFLLFLFTLAETGTPGKAPVLTIPTG
jgi:hypothetical protein